MIDANILRAACIFGALTLFLLALTNLVFGGWSAMAQRTELAQFAVTANFRSEPGGMGWAQSGGLLSIRFWAAAVLA